YKQWVEALRNPALLKLTPEQLYNRVVCSEHIPQDGYNSKRCTSLRFNVIPVVPDVESSADCAAVVDDPAVAVDLAGSAALVDVDDSGLSVDLTGSKDCTLHALSPSHGVEPNVGNMRHQVAEAIDASNSSTVTSIADSALSEEILGSASTSNSDHNYFSMDCSEGPQPTESKTSCFVTSTPKRPARKLVRRGYNRCKKMPAIPVVPKKNRTPLEDHLLKCAVAYKREAKQQRDNYLRKCQEIKELKTHKEEEALAFLQNKVNPRFFKFLVAEVQNFRRKPQARRWEQDVLADFESMRQRGPRCFRGLPFTKPTRKTLKGLTKKVHLEPGINRAIYEMVGNKAAAMSPEDRVCFVVFDEMSLKVCLSYLEEEDDIVGLADLGSLGRRAVLAEDVLVAMIRSVFGVWKHPLSFWYTNKKMTALDFSNIFQETIRALLEVGLDVRAIVTDGLQKNIAAEHLLGATYEDPYFFINGHKIVTLVDPPHMMKSMRNAVVNYLLRLADGSMVDVRFIKAFLLLDVEEFPRLAPKVTQRHADPNNFEKMNVGMAVRLFHPDVSSGIQTHILRGSLPPEAAATGKFCEKIYKFFQSFQGINYDENPQPMDFSCALSDLTSHREFWIEMINDMQRWEILGSDRVKVIRNWTMTVVAFLHLWDSLKISGFCYLPVGHVNQDCEENFFSGLRFNGGHRLNPSATDVPSAFLRSFVKFLTTESKGKNCRDDEAVNLFDFEELIDILKRNVASEPTEPTHLEIQEEEDDLEEGSSGDDWVRSIASAKVAAPIVLKQLAKLKCGECSDALVTQPQFPLHLPHTMSASAAEMDTLLPNSQVSTVVSRIYEAVGRLQNIVALSNLPRHGVLRHLEAKVSSIPEVSNLNLCEQHQEIKTHLIKAFCKKAIQDLLEKMNQEIKEKCSRTPKNVGPAATVPGPGPSHAPQKPCRKLQRVAHL
ncbi:Transposable element P transposase, partial [Frankliniella fusca]